MGWHPTCWCHANLLLDLVRNLVQLEEVCTCPSTFFALDALALASMSLWHSLSMAVLSYTAAAMPRGWGAARSSLLGLAAPPQPKSVVCMVHSAQLCVAALIEVSSLGQFS